MVTVGVDLVEAKRFRPYCTARGRTHRFVLKTFSKAERTYCFSFRDAAPHLAGTFAGKEAVQKATGIFSTPLTQLEIRRTTSGKPEVWVRGKRSRSISVSISHTKDVACAIVLCQSR